MARGDEAPTPPTLAAPPSRETPGDEARPGAEGAEALLAAFLLLALGSGLDFPMRLSVGLPLVMAGFVVAWMATSPSMQGAGQGPGTTRRSGAYRSASYAGLAALAALGSVGPQPWGPWGRWPAEHYQDAIHVFSWIAVGLIGAHASARPRWRRRVFLAVVIPALALQILTPLAVPRPLIDVWQLYQHALHALV